MKQCIFFFFCVFALMSCEKKYNTGTHIGMSPIYQKVDINDPSLIKASDPRSYDSLGGIVERGNYLYILEKYKGVHVVDNTDPKSPKGLKFWEIPGINIFTIDATRIYADNGKDLWVIDITDVNNLKVIDVEKDIFDKRDDLRPDNDYRGYFECVDLSKGIIIGWEKKQLNNPQCRTQRPNF